ncbi:hypothetical protein HDV01_002274, partial [Terramyces sp. JEL0728]
MKSELDTFISNTVPNLELSNLFFSYDDVYSRDLLELGHKFELLFASSLVVKYYLQRQTVRDFPELIPFAWIYDFDQEEEEDNSKVLLENIKVNFAHGISIPKTEKFVTSKKTPALIHNIKTSNAHHDILLLTDRGKKDGAKEVPLLIWLYLGYLKKESQYEKVAFLNGGGV